MKAKHPFFILFTLFVILSCSKEEVKLIKDEMDEVEVDEPITATTPCQFDLSSAKSGDTVNINCLLDLEGKTVTLPENITFTFNGGDIINGTINFSGDKNKIDGRLLNADLKLAGKVSLISETFEFKPNRWGIIEGKVDDVVADSNRAIFKSALKLIKEYGGSTFKIDKMDAFFRVDNIPPKTTPTQFAIIIPSDFSLVMTDNTHLRIQPNAHKQPTLLSILDVDNVNITGGILYGERDEHDYSSGGTHEWETLISIKGGRNIKVSKVKMIDSAGDGIGVSNLGHSFDPVYKPSIDVLIADNTFIRSRRNQISITDGREVIVENNMFIDASIHTDKSKGTAPGFAIDVEAVRGKNPAGPQQIAQDIIIRGNTEKGSRKGSFTVHTGDRVTIEDNTVEKFISYSTSIGTIIRNNRIESPTNDATGTAIFAGRDDLFEKNYDNKVYGNTIIGYTTGIEATNTKLEVYKNTITNCLSAIRLKNLNNSSVYENKIKSNREKSAGINSHSGSNYINNVKIYDNNIDVTSTGFNFIRQNIRPEESDFSFEVINNTVVNSGATVSKTNGFYFKKNTFNNRVRLVNAINGEFSENIISSELDGIRIDTGCNNIKISKNTINYTRNCIWHNNSDAVNIEESENDCKSI